MASENGADKARFVGGPRAIGALIPAVTRPAFRARSPAAAQLMADWTEIIGPALAAVTHPRRLAGGTLTLACSGPIALELQHLTGPLAERINAHFGRTLVERFRFVQSDPAASRATPAPPPPRPAPVEVPEIAPGPLHDALAALGGALAHRRAGHSGDPA
jgi:hypothetical protein